MVNYEWLLEKPDFFEKMFLASRFNYGMGVSVVPFAREWNVQIVGFGNYEAIKGTTAALPTEGSMYFGTFYCQNKISVFGTPGFNEIQLKRFALDSTLNIITLDLVRRRTIAVEDNFFTYETLQPCLLSGLTVSNLAGNTMEFEGKFFGLKISFKK